MSKTTYVKGNIIEITGGSNKIYSKENIEIIAGKQIIQNGGKNGIKFKKPKQPPVSQIKRIVKDCVVHFRPKSNWDGSGYGFDWVRNGDSKMQGDISQENTTGKYGAIYGSQAGAVFTKDKNAYKKLLRTFDPYNLIVKDKNGKDKAILYCVPIVSLYPKNILKVTNGKTSEVASGYKNTTANLKMLISIGKNPEKIELEYDKNLFEIKHNPIPLAIGNHKLEISVTCLKEFDKNHAIKVLSYYKNKQGNLEPFLSGKLNVLKNKQRYKAKFVFVNVSTNINGAKKPKKANPIGREKELKKYLNQALVNPIVETVAIDFSTNVDAKTKKKHNKKKRFNAIALPEINPNKPSEMQVKDGTSDKLYELLNTELYKQYPNKKYNNVYKVYFINESDSQVAGIGRSMDDDKSTTHIDEGKIKTVLVFKDGFSDSTVAHEVLHAMGLYHSFDNDGEFTFTFCQTDNIMDYSDIAIPAIPVITTYQWQWQKVWTKSIKE